MPASAKDPEGWSAADKFTLVLETAGLNATELSAYCRERGLFPQQVDRWRKAAEDSNAQPLLTMDDQKNLQKRHQEDQRQIKMLQQEGRVALRLLPIDLLRRSRCSSRSCAVRTGPWRRRRLC